MRTVISERPRSQMRESSPVCVCARGFIIICVHRIILYVACARDSYVLGSSAHVCDAIASYSSEKAGWPI